MNKKVKILFHYMLGVPGGGSDNSLFYHIVNLNRAKFEPIVVFNKFSKHKEILDKMKIQTCIINLYEEKKYIPNTEEDIIKTHPVWEFIKVKFGREVKALIKTMPEIKILFKLKRKYGFDILHTNYNLSASRAAVLACILLRVPTVVHNRGLSNLLKIDVLISKFVSQIICISDFVKTEYTDFGIPEKKCTIIYNGVDISKFCPKEIGNENKIIVTSVGRLDYWKGQHILVETAQILSKSFNNVEFWIVGDGVERERLEKMNTSNTVKFLGYKENINEILNKSDIFIHNSIEPEPFGRVIIEAMATALPVISTNIGGPREIINDGVDGFLIQPNNTNALEHVLRNLLQSKELRDQIGKKARKKIEDQFSISKTTLRIQKVYTKI